MLGSHLRAISAHIDKSLYEEGTLRVVAVGSVFRSWKFLKPGTTIRRSSSRRSTSSVGFADALSNGNPLPFTKVQLVQLTAPAAIGKRRKNQRTRSNRRFFSLRCGDLGGPASRESVE